MGRFWHEDVCRNAVAQLVRHEQRTEVLIEVTWETFCHRYSMDLLVDGGAVFELKNVVRLGPAHRAQLLNYLLLCELSFGKLVNFHAETVEHEFVNTTLKHADRKTFRVNREFWKEPESSGRCLLDWLMAFLQDVGAGLDVHLYESAVAHFFGGNESVLHEIDVILNGQAVGTQKVRLAASDLVFKVTTIGNDDLPRFEDHARRF